MDCAFLEYRMREEIRLDLITSPLGLEAGGRAGARETKCALRHMCRAHDVSIAHKFCKAQNHMCPSNHPFGSHCYKSTSRFSQYM